MTELIRLWIQNQFPQQCLGSALERVRSPDIRRELGVELLLPRKEPVEAVLASDQDPPGRLPPCGRPRTCWSDYMS